MKFNSKINCDGTYRKYCGWSVVSDSQTDLKFIYNYISKNNVLKKYISPLPSESYHVTLYNLWSNGVSLLPEQIKVCNKMLEEVDVDKIGDLKNQLQKESKTTLFNPNGCLDKMFVNLQEICNEKDEEWVLTVDKVYYNRTSVGIMFKHNNLKKIDKIRNKMVKYLDSNRHNPVYHLTLAYHYTLQIPENFETEIKILNLLLENQTITLKKPNVVQFTDMLKFTPVFGNFKRKDLNNKEDKRKHEDDNERGK